MPWSKTRDNRTNPKYRGKAHRELSAHYKREIRAGRYLPCTARVCLFDRSLISNPNGNADDGVTVGHADNGIDYAGPQHRLCNTTDGSVRARARQNVTRLEW